MPYVPPLAFQSPKTDASWGTGHCLGIPMRPLPPWCGETPVQPGPAWCAAGGRRAFATLGHSNTGLLEAMCARLLALLEPFSGPEAVPLSTRTSARSPSAFPSQAFANSAW